MRPSIELGGLRFNFISGVQEVTSKALYGVYHGRFVESVATHCDDRFSEASVTSRGTNADFINTKVA